MYIKVGQVERVLQVPPLTSDCLDLQSLGRMMEKSPAESLQNSRHRANVRLAGQYQY